MELALSLGNRGEENNNNMGFSMGLGLNNGSSSSSPPSKSREEDQDQDDVIRDDYDDDVDDQEMTRGASSDQSQPSIQLDLLRPFSPVVVPPPPHQQPPPLRFSWLADNLSSEPAGLSNGPGSRTVYPNRQPVVEVRPEEVEDQSSPNSGTSSFMEFSLYTSSNNNSKGKGKREGGEKGNYGSNYGQELTTSRGSDDEENGSTRKKLRLSKQQSAFLEESFKEHHTLNPKQKLALAKQLNLRPRQVEVWFQNRRARTKLKQTEVDCEYLKRCCETLTEENRRLQKELQELRALKTSQPFFSHLPPTTLTMCPSCERVAPTSTSAPASSAPPTTATAATTTAATGSPPATAVGSANSITLSLGGPKPTLPFSQAQAQAQAQPKQAAS